MKKIVLISTGGTIEKTYDELSGLLNNQVSVLDIMLSKIELRGVEIERLALMSKDSLDMTLEDHALIAATASRAAETHDGVIVVHGTDRLAQTGDTILEVCGQVAAPIILTGAMRPYAQQGSRISRRDQRSRVGNICSQLILTLVRDIEWVPGLPVALYL